MPVQQERIEDLSAATVDRRSQPRYDPLCEITPLVELPRGTLRAQVLDITPDGDVCLLFHERPGVKVGAKLFIWYGPTRETGVVRYVDRTPDQYRLGVRLLD